jgi:type I restriction enzyme S subunit
MFKKYDAYKDSGEGWIGLIPEHWEIVKLKHLFNEKRHKKNMSLNSGSISFGEVVYKDDEKITEATKASYQEVLKGEFLVNPLNLNYDLISLRIALSKIDVVVSAGYIVLTANNVVCKDYFKYLLHRYDVAYMKLLGSGVRQTISFNHIANSVLPYPNLLEQEKIAKFLDQKTAEIDQAIVIKEQQIALLNERKQIVIQKAVTQGLDPHLPMKDSGVEWIGSIPEHWEIQKLAYLAKLDSGSTPDRSNLKFWSNGTIPWLKTGEINYNLIDSSEEFVTPLALSKTALKLAPKGTLLMAMYGQGITRGRVAILNFEATYNQACCAIQCKAKLINWYLFHFFVFAYSFIRDGGNETSQMNISTGYISNLRVVLPPVEEQLKIISYLDSEMEKYEEAKINLKQQIEKLKEYKTTLINDAVTGKIKVA